MEPKTYAELMRAVEKLLPFASWGRDNSGQIVIYTNIKRDGDNVVEMTKEDFA